MTLRPRLSIDEDLSVQLPQLAHAGIEAQKTARDAALDDIDRDGNVMNT